MVFKRINIRSLRVQSIAFDLVRVHPEGWFPPPTMRTRLRNPTSARDTNLGPLPSMINNPMEPPPEPDVGPETDLPLEAALTTPGDTDDSAGNETPPTEEAPPQATRFAPTHVALIVLGSVAFLYFARPVMLPILLAWMAATTLRPAVRWLSYLRLPTPVSAAVVF